MIDYSRLNLTFDSFIAENTKIRLDLVLNNPPRKKLSTVFDIILYAGVQKPAQILRLNDTNKLSDMCTKLCFLKE